LGLKAGKGLGRKKIHGVEIIDSRDRTLLKKVGTRPTDEGETAQRLEIDRGKIGFNQKKSQYEVADRHQSRMVGLSLCGAKREERQKGEPNPGRSNAARTRSSALNTGRGKTGDRFDPAPIGA